MSWNLSTYGPFEYVDEDGNCFETSSNGKCKVEFKLEKEIEEPHLYLELKDFYTSHRIYAHSLSWYNLRNGGEYDPEELVDSCEPVRQVKDLFLDFDHKYPNDVVYSVNGTILNNDDAVYPCGAIAKFIFDDAVSI